MKKPDLGESFLISFAILLAITMVGIWYWIISTMIERGIVIEVLSIVAAGIGALVAIGLLIYAGWAVKWRMKT